MADIVTNITNQTEYNNWLSGLPASDDGNVHIANITTSISYNSAQLTGINVDIRIQADPSVAFNFSNPTAAHVSFTNSGTETFYLRGTPKTITIKGVEIIADLGDVACIRLDSSAALTARIEECKTTGGNVGTGTNNANADVLFTNCVVDGANEFGIDADGNAANVRGENCVIVNCNVSDNSFRGGVVTATGSSWKNTVAFNNNRSDWDNALGTLTNCASGDSTAYGTGAVTGVVKADFDDFDNGVFTSASGGALDGTGESGANIGLNIAPSVGISISSPVAYFMVQRDSSNEGQITVSGSYSDGGTPPTSIEGSFNGGAFQTLDASPSGGTYTGTLTNLPPGNGEIVVRFSNMISINASVQNIAVGDIFLSWGQSNFSGRANNAQTYTGTAGFFHKYTVTNDLWEEGDDPFDTDTASGSLWPLFASLYVSTVNVPVGIIGVAEGNTLLSQWQVGQTLNTRMLTYYANAGSPPVKGVLSWIGENDANAGTSQTDFTNQYNAVINQLKTLTGADSIICGIAQSNGANVRQWTSDIVTNNANAVQYVNMNNVYTGIHYETDVDTQGCAQELFNGVADEFFSSTLNLSITGIPDGTFMTVLDNENGSRLFRGNITYSSGSASQMLVTMAGTRIKGYVDDANNPSTNAAYIEGVTV